MAEYDWDFRATKTFSCCGAYMPNHRDSCTNSNFYKFWVFGVNKVRDMYRDSQWYCGGCGSLLAVEPMGHDTSVAIHFEVCFEMQSLNNIRKSL